MNEIQRAAMSALWYAWGQIDRDPQFGELRFDTDQGYEFSGLWEQLTQDYVDGKRNAKPSLLDAWQEFVRSKAKTPEATLTVDDIDPYVRLSREVTGQ